MRGFGFRFLWIAALLPLAMLWGCSGSSSSSSPSPGPAKATISGTVSFPSLSSLVSKQVAAATPPTLEVLDLSGNLVTTVTLSNPAGSSYTYTVPNLAIDNDYVLKAMNGSMVMRSLVSKTDMTAASPSRPVNTNTTTAVIVIEQTLGLTAGTLGQTATSTQALTASGSFAALPSSTVETGISTALSACTSGTATTAQANLASLASIVGTAVFNNVDPAAFVAGTVPAGTTVTATTYSVSGGTTTSSSTSVTPAVAGTTASSVAGILPGITSANTATFTIGTAGSFTVTGNGTFTVSGALPSGVTFDSATGVLSGTPATGSNGTYPLTFTAASNGLTVTRTFTLTVQTGLPTIATEFSIAATSGREFSIGAAFDGTNYLVGIQGDQISGNNVTAQLVSGTTGSLVGPRISVGRTGGAPSVAFDGTNYLMIWPDDATNPNDILTGQLISKTGQLIGSLIPINQSINDGGPIIFDGSNYLAVWSVENVSGSGGTRDIYGQFISPSGTLLGSLIPISTAIHGRRDPALSFDGTNILVVWADGRNQSACYTDPGFIPPQGTHCFESDVFGQFVTKSAPSSAGSLSGSNFLINASTLPRDGNGVSVAFDGTNYFVVFSEETTLPNACPASGCKWDVFGQFVTKAGVPTGSKITISNTAPDHHFPGVVWNGTKYLTAWIESFGTPTTSVKGRYFDTSGAPIGSQLSLFSTGNDGRIPLAFPIVNGSNYFAIVNRGIPGTDPFNFDAYTSQDVLGAFITP